MQLDLLLVVFVSIAAMTDLRSRRIPNALVASGLAASLMLHGFSPAGQGLAFALLGALTGFALFLPMYLLKGMAAGDVKLMAAVGAFAGPATTVHIALAAFVVGGVLAIVLIIGKGCATHSRTCAPWCGRTSSLPPGQAWAACPTGSRSRRRRL